MCCLEYIVGDCIKLKTEPGDITDYPQGDYQPADIGMLYTGLYWEVYAIDQPVVFFDLCIPLICHNKTAYTGIYSGLVSSIYPLLFFSNTPRVICF